jgi:hypothetical protein
MTDWLRRDLGAGLSEWAGKHSRTGNSNFQVEWMFCEKSEYVEMTTCECVYRLGALLDLGVGGLT